VLVAVAVKDTDITPAEHAVSALGATVRSRQPLTPGRALLLAEPGPTPAEPVVAALRAAGWRAVARPEGGGHLAVWRTHTAPVVVEGRLCVCFPWAEFDRAGAPPAIEVDPGPSFGTGAHPSTRLLLNELARRTRPGQRALDVGCGSGVLSLAAALLGAAAVATDIDPAALEATAANAAWNGLAVDVCDTLPPGPFDIVVANIGADQLVSLAPAVRDRVAPGGWIGLSGISPAQVSRVGAAYGRPGETRQDGEWAALIVCG
jgi:ribosomal protein L11 methyltransferase